MFEGSSCAGSNLLNRVDRVYIYSKTGVNGHSQKDQKLVFKTNYCSLQVKSVEKWEHSVILLAFIKLPFVIKIFVLSIFEWPFYTGFTVLVFNSEHSVSFSVINLFLYFLIKSWFVAVYL